VLLSAPGAALAAKDGALTIALVFVIGAAAAYVGDLLTFFTVRQTSSTHGRIGRWVNKERQSKAVQRVERAFEKRPMRTMMVSRLVPGGRTPVLIVVALDEYAFAKYAAADIIAAVSWSAYYTASGLVGRALFANAWEAVAASLALALLISVFGSLWTRWREHRADPISHGKASE
jgi:membrane protein DedA with SNARE-associated domain